MKLKKINKIKKKKAQKYDPQLKAVIALAAKREFKQARELCRQVLNVMPNSARANKIMGYIHQQTGNIHEAERFYSMAVKLEPNNDDYYSSIGSFYFLTGQQDKAMPHLRKALALNPSSHQANYYMGSALLGLRNWEEALQYLKKTLKIKPDYMPAYGSIAAIHEMRNDFEKLEETIRQTKKFKHNSPAVLLHEASLLRRRGDIEGAKECLQRIIDFGDDQSKIGIAYIRLGKLLDSQKQYEKAYENFIKGQQVFQRARRHNVKMGTRFDSAMASYRKWYKPENMQDWQPTKTELGKEKIPAFVFGFPRSGTTLTEQILSSHPNLCVMSEYSVIEHMIINMEKYLGREVEYPAVLNDISADDIKKLQEKYMELSLQAIKHHTGEGAKGRRLVDKMPFNFIHLPFVYKLFPRAKIIMLIRDPRDSILSGLMQTFVNSVTMNKFSRLETGAELYDETMELYLRVRNVLPLELMELRYEDLVADPENKIKEMVKFIGEEWTDEVLNYYKQDNKRDISTPSYEAVSKPIYKRAKERWRNYENHIKKVENRLMPYIKEFGYRT